MSASVIRTDALTRIFGSTGAVNGLTMEVPEGRIFGFLGPNGAGKTTTIRMLLGLIPPTSGGADVLGFSVVRDPEKIRERCGALLEHTGLYERLSVYDNLEFAARSRAMTRGERKARIGELLERFGLSDRRNDPSGKLSKGMKQNLSIARAILHRPPLVFLDEPSSGLDVVSAARLREDIAGLVREEGTSVFLTTHNLNEAERLCSDIGVIRNGRLVFSGTPGELKSRAVSGKLTVETVGSGRILRDPAFAPSFTSSFPFVSEVEIEGDRLTVSIPPGTGAAPIVEYLVGRGIRIEEARKGGASLEQAFLDLLSSDENGDEQ